MILLSTSSVLKHFSPPCRTPHRPGRLFGSRSPPPLCSPHWPLNLCPKGDAMPVCRTPVRRPEHTVLGCLEECHLSFLCCFALGFSQVPQYRSLQVKLCLSLAPGHARGPSCFLFFFFFWFGLRTFWVLVFVFVFLFLTFINEENEEN